MTGSNLWSIAAVLGICLIPALLHGAGIGCIGLQVLRHKDTVCVRRLLLLSGKQQHRQ